MLATFSSYRKRGKLISHLHQPYPLPNPPAEVFLRFYSYSWRMITTTTLSSLRLREEMILLVDVNVVDDDARE
ncbi:UNVERIFIED_CONTAM: hypothetical protein PYX00_004450 [Menopon gallinae]|uniref:Uncharacterized protein n=1 Tax=Menopon gallinae TaxID=328185 RepID=A0AAW2I515_9NEOP